MKEREVNLGELKQKTAESREGKKSFFFPGKKRSETFPSDRNKEMKRRTFFRGRKGVYENRNERY